MPHVGVQNRTQSKLFRRFARSLCREERKESRMYETAALCRLFVQPQSGHARHEETCSKIQLVWRRGFGQSGLVNTDAKSLRRSWRCDDLAGNKGW